MKKNLGLDLGVSSIGWAYILENADNKGVNQILGAGVRIVPLNNDEVKEFGKGGNVPTNVARRMARGARRNLQRFKLRRNSLYSALKRLGMAPDDQWLRSLPPGDLFELREKALKERLTPTELGRVFLHLNLRRGYKSNRKDRESESTEKKQDTYLGQIEAREHELQERKQTIGQRFADGLRENPHYRVRQQIFNRATYVEEFDMVWAAQSKFHSDLLTPQNRKLLRDMIIYRQRPLRSQKGLVGTCALESNYRVDKSQAIQYLPNGLPKLVSPKCAPKSSPLAQEIKVWESLHNLRIYKEDGEEYILSLAEKKRIFNVLQERSTNLMPTALLRDVLNLSTKNHTVDERVKEKGLECNQTIARLTKVFKDLHINDRSALKFDPVMETGTWVITATGEQVTGMQVRADFDQEPLYQLWHLLYATQEEADVIRILQERYGFTLEQATGLAALDFTSAGYANKSHRAMRRLLPHYREGLDYTSACKAAGYNHSNSLTKAEVEGRTLQAFLNVIPKNSLRNPVVEKILNQMINLVNAILDPASGFGAPDEIRVELARELKQSAKERQTATKRNNQREKENTKIRGLIADHLKIQPERVTRVQIEKWKLWDEVNGISIYTGKTIERRALLLGEGIDIEHIIPKTRQFDDSFENKTICETYFNQEKGKMTARDFMEAQPVSGLQFFDAFLRTVKELYDQKKISKSKYNRLLLRVEEIPDDFLARQLKDSQYIVKKARQILMDVCRQVHSTSGGVTDFLRHQWGWDETIQDLRLPQFKEAGLTEYIPIKKGSQQKEVIAGWNKRLDHRHHALDALTVACTTPAHIKRINDLNQTLEGRLGQERRQALMDTGRDKFLAGAAPFSYADVCEVLEGVLISFKQGTRVATRSKNNPKGSKKTPQITLTPRGSLHEETIYGKIKFYKKVPLNSKFDVAWLETLVHTHQRDLIQKHLDAFGNDPKKAFKDLIKNPILYGKSLDKKLTHVTIWGYTYTSRKNIGPLLTEKAVDKILDKGVQQVVKARLSAGGGKSAEAFKNVGSDPIMHGNVPVKRVRVENPAAKMVALPRGFAEPGSNHHIAIYQDAAGKKFEHVVTFWDAFQRLRLGLPAVITNVSNVYATIAEMQGNLPDLHLPDHPDWQFVTAMMQNDMFVFGVDSDELMSNDPKVKAKISKGLFRVRKLSSGNYWFMHHLETQILEDTISKSIGRAKFASPASIGSAIKVKIDRLGNISPFYT
jgi:CRISPR-associated endonuclease Csn1